VQDLCLPAATSFEWSADGIALYYSTADESGRPCKVSGQVLLGLCAVHTDLVDITINTLLHVFCASLHLPFPFVTAAVLPGSRWHALTPAGFS
jgi:hypothetical protein